MIPKNVLQCIAAEDDDDASRVRIKAKALGVNNYTIWTMKHPPRSEEELAREFSRPKPSAELARAGVDGWLVDTFEASLIARFTLFSNAIHLLRVRPSPWLPVLADILSDLPFPPSFIFFRRRRYTRRKM